MIFLIGMKNPGLGALLLGYVEVRDKKTAQELVIERLVSAGTPQHRIAQQVTDNSTLEIGLSTVTIVPISEFDEKKASALVALL